MDAFSAEAVSSREAFAGHTGGEVFAVAFSPDGATVASSGADGTVRLWDARSGEPTPILTGHTGWVNAVAFSPDGATVASSGADGTVRLWDARSGEPTRTLTGPTGWVHAVAFSPDGATVASAGADGVVRLWDARSGEPTRTLTGHTNRVSAVAFSPDGATVASAGDDGTIRVWNPRTGRQVAGTGFGVSSWRPRTLAGVRSDRPSDEDLLDFRHDVETLAALVTAVDTEPPLAIALLGDWGSGKSSLMSQMHRQVQQLADLSLSNLGLSSFAANVRQVTFNAWHYADQQLWTGLVEHLFRELASGQGATATDQSASDSAAERKRLRARVTDLRAQDEELTGELTRFSAQPASGLRSPTAYGRLAAAALRVLRRDWLAYLLILIAWAFLAAVASVVWLWLGADIDRIFAAIAAALAPVVVVIGRLQSWRRSGQRLSEHVRGQLERRRRQVREALADESARLAEVDAAVRLSRFLAERSSPTSYEQYRGLLGQVHRDLQQLDKDLRAARGHWEANPTPAPPLERIILYIDDLDRCPPQRVVEVLAAVHLMLALPLFVVVAAVDPRWLLGSLQHHYAELFTSTGGEIQGDAESHLATPLDYLDKIFQIPFAVTPLSGATAGKYLTALVQPDQEARTSPPPTAQSAAPNERDSDRDRADEIPDGPGYEELHTPEPARTPTTDGRRGIDHESPAHPPTTGPATTAPGEEPPARVTAKQTEPKSGASTAHAIPTAAPDLRAESLQLTQPETDFLPTVAPLLPTPRAAKKLVNLYRLIRISIHDNDLPAFLTTRTFEPVLLQLALIVGAPSDARSILAAIMATADSSNPDLADLLNGDTACGVSATDWNRTKTTRDRMRAILQPSETAGAGTLSDLATHKRWCSTIARFSFHTRALATAAPLAPTATPATEPTRAGTPACNGPEPPGQLHNDTDAGALPTEGI